MYLTFAFLPIIKLDIFLYQWTKYNHQITAKIHLITTSNIIITIIAHNIITESINSNFKPGLLAFKETLSFNQFLRKFLRGRYSPGYRLCIGHITIILHIPVYIPVYITIIYNNQYNVEDATLLLWVIWTKQIICLPQRLLWITYSNTNTSYRECILGNKEWSRVII